MNNLSVSKTTEVVVREEKSLLEQCAENEPQPTPLFTPVVAICSSIDSGEHMHPFQPLCGAMGYKPIYIIDMGV